MTKLFRNGQAIHPFYTIKSISAEGLKSGKYTLKATIELKGKSYSTEKEFDFQNGVQPLKGTVITAESSKGGSLQSGVVHVYEVYKGPYRYKILNSVVSEQMKNVDGSYEAFIPDAYLLDGVEYLVVVTDTITKEAYTKKIVGQKDKYIHFNAKELKEIKLDTGNLTTIDTNFKLVDPAINFLNSPFSFLDWVGKLEQIIPSMHVGKERMKKIRGTVGQE